jgi:hypothetical protein
MMPETSSATSGPGLITIALPPDFTRSQQQVIHRYLTNPAPLQGDEWLQLIQAMDILRKARVVSTDNAETFAALYDRLVDAVYSNGAIQQLLALSEPEREGEALRATISRSIVADLRTRELWRPDAPDTQLLVAFCLYWWQAFVRGYAFEIAIYRDLTANGIAFTSHDLHERAARLSGFDLEIMGYRGDIKTSTYFVLARRSEMLAHDFYITRMYQTARQSWQRVVWLKPGFWRGLNGAPTPVAYENIWQVLPGVAEIVLRGRKFVVVPYDDWKNRIIVRQKRKVKHV